MILCHCHIVNDQAVARAVDSGATTLAHVCRTTRAGQDCGVCVFSIKHAVRNHLTSPAAKLAGAASG
jgi:bacterioferritin-associated ferredoxin